MKELLRCLEEWLNANRSDAKAFELLAALTTETLKRVESPDPAQREFDALALAEAAGREGDFESAKRFVQRSKFELFLQERQTNLEAHFQAAGHASCVRIEKRSTSGKHRAVWFLSTYLITVENQTSRVNPAGNASGDGRSDCLEYERDGPGSVQPSWLVRPLLGSGEFETKSLRGLVWMVLAGLVFLYVLLLGASGLLFLHETRPLQVRDLHQLVISAIVAWFAWRYVLRPLVWLMEDRVVLVSDAWVAGDQEAAQLELGVGESQQRVLRFVRYSAVCTVCAGKVQLRYAKGPNPRRLIGCCAEAPHDHVFTFDRVSRTGVQLLP